MSCAPSARACPSSRGGSVGGRRGVARAGGCRCRSPVPPPLLCFVCFFSLHRHRRPNGGMGLIIDQREIVEGEIEDGPHSRIDLHARQWKRCAAELQLGLFEVVEIGVGVAAGAGGGGGGGAAPGGGAGAPAREPGAGAGGGGGGAGGAGGEGAPR